MNIERGLKRLYYVLAAAWITVWLLIFIGQKGPLPGDQIPAMAAVVLGPPGLIYLIVFSILPWIGAGFRKEPAPTQPIYCGECGSSLETDWTHCPRCGTKSWKVAE